VFVDYGRYMVMIVLIQFMLVFYLVYKEDETMLAVIGKIVPIINKNWFIIIIACLVMLFLEPVNAIGPSDKVRHIFRGIMSLFGINY
jgi:hypothetical protein